MTYYDINNYFGRFSYFVDDLSIHIHYFVVHKPYRNQGYGRKLFHELLHCYQPKIVTIHATILDDLFWKKMDFHYCKDDYHFSRIYNMIFHSKN